MSTYEEEWGKIVGPEPVTEDPNGPSAELDAEPLAPSGPEGQPGPALEAPKDTPNEPAAPRDPEVQKDPEPQKAAPKTVEDLFSLVPEAEKEAWAPAIQQARSDLGRVSALNKLLLEARQAADKATKEAQEVKDRIGELEAKAAAVGTTGEASDLSGEAGDLEREFPELAKGVKMLVDSKLKSLLPAPAPKAPDPARPQTVDPGIDPEVDSLAKEYAALNAAHPDWQKHRSSAEFNAWFGAQPTSVQTLMSSSLAKDNILLMDSFKTHLKTDRDRQAAAQREADRKRLSKSVDVRGGPSAAPSAPSDFESAWAYYTKGM